ncbi:NAD-dependent epimerase/dehydratase family protein [Phytoactinopolyspora endophytica]|uniref:NAD-dependent epimerase/dehydratase family protein n=1 Tax=Phytoactinopolyspora endophytica TaxID=1642495 RepID=UPI0013E9DF27|nr:NAD(P)-dependent oxidoreductase [Phytoactinopolyspora endophytica]
MTRTVLVTGAAGQLGRAVVQTLRAAGSAVVAVDRSPAEVGDTGIRVADLTDTDAVNDVIAGCDAVIHLAALRSPGLASAATVFSNNTLATFQVLTTAAAHGVRNVAIASSIAMYGMTFGPSGLSPEYVPVDEDHPVTPYDPYALSKQTDEATAAMVHRSTGMTIVVLRVGWVASKDAIRTRMAEVAEDPTVAKSVRELWSYLEEDDAARAFAAALGVPDGCHAVQVVAPDSLSGTPTAELVDRYHPTTRIDPALTGTTGAWTAGRAAELLGLGPMWSWRDGPAMTKETA